jgi:hypothetical protein
MAGARDALVPAAPQVIGATGAYARELDRMTRQVAEF